MTTKNIRIEFEENKKNPWFTWFMYPAGEIDVRLSQLFLDEVGQFDCEINIDLIMRITSPTSLIVSNILINNINCIKTENANNYNNQINVKYYLPYLPYSRADRQFVKGGNFGLADFNGIIDPYDYKCFITFDRHSKVNCGSIITNVSSQPLIECEVLQSFYKEFGSNTDEINILLPDKGAKDRYGVIDSFQVPNYDSKFPNYKTIRVNVDHCEKERDTNTGKFLGFKVPQNLKPVATLIIDDLCDGGGTFLGIGALIPQEMPLALYVSHGIFSKGIEVLLERFDKVYTTNSFKSEYEPNDKLEVFDCIPYLLGES